jgi:hypothetical protein
MQKVLAVLAITLLVTACSPPAPTAPVDSGSAQQSSAVDAATTDPLAIAATPTVSAEIGIPVALHPRVSRIDGDWGWLVAQPWTPEGAAIDWSQTRLAGAAEHGAMDASGTVYVLLKRENGAWGIVNHAIAPTDVAWEGWAQQYGAPASLFATQ